MVHLRSDRLLTSDGGLRLAFHLRALGWADVGIQVADEVHTFRVSYISDALGDLVRAVLALGDGSSTSSAVTWQQEPAVVELAFRTDDGTSVCITVRQASSHGEPSNVVATVSTGLGELRSAVLDMCRQVDTQAYREWWNRHAFPDHAIDQLRAAGRAGSGPPEAR